MLDELLGRAALKDRIADLETDNERLEAQLDAERERRQAAVRDRQTVDEHSNRLEDRIADLEGQLERAGRDDRGPSLRGAEVLRAERRAEVLDRLERFDTGPEGALTAMVEPGAVPEVVSEALGDRARLVARVAPCLVLADDACLVSVALAPPLPPEPFATWDAGFALDRSWFEPTGGFALALVRADLFAYGEYDGRERTHVAGFESDVKNRHAKGGFSQARFERRRDEQVRTHLDRCREVLAERDPERLVVVGDRSVVDALDVEAVATAAVDATGDPASALDDAFDAFFATTLYRI